ncbi:TPA: tRNA uridine(34) 5-carboxymethylaminomethyl modification radical SAM/GNAT enzyme Elp3 [Candidatus Bathyarchaeota archaeon]|nr:tRNA uridine(34) 5-carboxymethylaminomethyl modification radical SAM/GNAT enzyme Elp3 [Candidatus Bathyarchaeota archaeon]
MEGAFDRACREIIRRIRRDGIRTKRELNRLKLEVSARYGLGRIPSDSDILRYAPRGVDYERYRDLLVRKRVRTLSGVVVVAVMTKPWPCPKGQPCIYCPGGVPYNLPQSYTGHEPASARGIQYGYDPYEQVRGRVNQLRAIGHPVDKVELIIMGGTFPAMPVDYQEHFVKECLDAITGRRTKGLDEAKREAEASEVRNSGITVETRPDWAKEGDVDHMLSMGVTRVELGVQNIYDDVYELVNRGHTVDDVIKATRIVKDAGLKCAYHLMPGLPGSTYERDLNAFRMIFQDPRFRPDELKVYPTLVLRGTKLFEMWRRGEYRPLPTDRLIDLIARVKSDYVPEYVRIKRVMRDIPAHLIVAGPRAGNLRELVWRRLAELGKRCSCIRCREVGHVARRFGVKPDPEDVKPMIRVYEASEGTELFLSYEDMRRGILIGFLRLRIPSEHAHRREVREVPSALVRELHVYGSLVPVGEEPLPPAWQHRGYGRMLLFRAEEMARDQFDAKRILVTSGLGVRRYYHALGYKPCGPYCGKSL